LEKNENGDEEVEKLAVGDGERRSAVAAENEKEDDY